jgi:hypothetical protein
MVGGGAASSYPVWTESVITFQLGSSAASGTITVNTPTGTSNALPFTVRAGRIYFVAADGSDESDGSFATPWRTLFKARDSVTAGDIVYARDGVYQSSDDGSGWNTCFSIGGVSGAAGSPIAFVVYPGESAIIGSTTDCSSGVRAKGQGEHYWIIAGFNLRGRNEALTTYSVHDWRVIGNDMTCPNGNGVSACFETSLTTNLKVYGNNVHDVGAANASSLYHGVYLSTDSNHIDLGWNTIANVHGCRGVQVHSSPLNGSGPDDPTGYNQYDMVIHDNVIHDTQCDGVVLATIDPSKGQIALYNNVIYNAGKGPDNPERSGSWSCVNVRGYANNGAPGVGVVEIYSNTFYNCGSFANPPYPESVAGLISPAETPNIIVRIRNNIFYVSSNAPYLLASDGSGGNCMESPSCTAIQGSNNLFFGSGGAPRNTGMQNSIEDDPQFTDAGSGDFRLSANSPARNAGMDTGLAMDLNGNPITGSTGIDIGALQYAGSTIKPNATAEPRRSAIVK